MGTKLALGSSEGASHHNRIESGQQEAADIIHARRGRPGGSRYPRQKSLTYNGPSNPTPEVPALEPDHISAHPGRPPQPPEPAGGRAARPTEKPGRRPPSKRQFGSGRTVDRPAPDECDPGGTARDLQHQ